MEMLQGVWKQHLRPRAVVGYGVKIFLPSPPNYVTRSPGSGHRPEPSHRRNFSGNTCLTQYLPGSDFQQGRVRRAG